MTPNEEKATDEKPKIEVLGSPKHEPSKASVDAVRKQIKGKEGSFAEEKPETKPQGKKGKHKNRKKKQKKDTDKIHSEVTAAKSEQKVEQVEVPCVATEKSKETVRQDNKASKANETSSTVVNEEPPDSVIAKPVCPTFPTFSMFPDNCSKRMYS